jgi:hypothetical protein
MELFQLLGTIAIDNQKAIEDIDETTDKAEQSESKMSAAFKKVGAVVATAFAVDKIKEFGTQCVEAAASVKATNSQFEQVFGDLKDKASSSLSKIADDTGIIETRMKSSYTQIAAFAKTTGMETADALELSNRAMAAVADSAAYYDRSLEDTTESLQSFLKGNYENDSALGLSCTETTRNAAANKLYGKSFKELSESQKQLTLLQMVEDANKLSGALGQAARESDGWENVMGNLHEAWKNFQATIGAPVLSAVVPIIQKLTDGLAVLGEKTGAAIEFARENEGIIKTVAAGMGILTAAIVLQNGVQAVKTAMNAAETASLTALIAAKAADAAATMAALAPYLLIVAAIAAVIAIGVLLYKNWDTIKEKAGELKDKLSEKWEGLKSATSAKFNDIKSKISDSISSAKEKVSSKASEMYDSWNGKLSNMKSAAQSKFGSMHDSISGKMETIKSTVKNGVQKLKDFFNFDWKLPKIKLPHFNISGEFSLNPPSVPSFGIEWYKKGGIMTEPTAFGINPANGKTMVGGEAGAEAIAPIETLKQYIMEAITEAGTSNEQKNIQNNFNFTSPKAIDAREAARLFRKQLTNLQLGY